MAGPGIPLHDLNSDDDAPLNDPHHTEAVNKAHKFRFKQPNLILFFKTFIRCLATIVLIASLLATLKIYENKGNFTSHQKSNFNVIITALSLCLGLNFFVSHNFHGSRRHNYRDFLLTLRDFRTHSKTWQKSCDGKS